MGRRSATTQVTCQILSVVVLVDCVVCVASTTAVHHVMARRCEW
jgi:hypothetical protein